MKFSGRGKKAGFTIEEMYTACSIIVLVAALSLPVLVRLVNNLKSDAVIATLRSLLEAQKSYRDAQTPTTYANTIETLINQNYVAGPATRYGYTFRIASATPDAFTIEARNRSNSCHTINQFGAFGTSCIEDEPGGGPGGGDPPGGGGCFLAGTPILMADGSTKPIELVRVGDEVLAFDEATKTFQKDIVKEFLVHDVGEHNADRYWVVNGHLKVTPNHPVYTNGRWTQIKNLSLGDHLFNAKGKPEPITSIQVVKQHVKVYNLEINPYHTYIAGGIVVHNGAGGDCGEGPCHK